MKILTFLIIALTMISCKNEETRIRDKIKGIWIFQGRIKQKELKNAIKDNYFKNQVLFHFKTNKKLIIRNFKNYDTIFNWNVTEDSILKFDKYKYFIDSINKEKMNLYEYKYGDTIQYVFMRPLNVDLNISLQKAEKILTTNIWQHKNTEYNPFFIEFFDDHLMYKRFKHFDNNVNDSINSYYQSIWELYKYDNFLFLNDPVLSDYGRVFQIVGLDYDSLKLIGDYYSGSTQKFKSKNYLDKRKLYRKLLLGNWVSKNTNDRRYRDNSEKIRMRSPFCEHAFLFEGEVKLNIDIDMAILNIDDLQPIEYEWNLGEDPNTLILKKKFDDNDYYLEPHYILELTERKLKIRLNSFYRIGKYKPNILLINDIQEFHKVNK